MATAIGGFAYWKTAHSEARSVPKAAAAPSPAARASVPRLRPQLAGITTEPVGLARTTTHLADETTDWKYQQRQSWLREWDEWVSKSRLTPDQEAKALQLIADAQEIYGSAGEARDEMSARSSRMINKRMSPEQKAIVDKASKEKMDLYLKHKDEPGWLDGPEWLAAQDKAQATIAPIYAALMDTQPAEEQRASNDSGDADNARDLLADTESAMAEFLDEQQIRTFHDDIGDGFDMLLKARIARPRSQLVSN